MLSTNCSLWTTQKKRQDKITIFYGTCILAIKPIDFPHIHSNILLLEDVRKKKLVLSSPQLTSYFRNRKEILIRSVAENLHRWIKG